MDNEVMRERMIRDANHDTMMSILHKKASMGEGEAAYDQDHDKIMAMLHRRIATGEGDEYGGWIKPLNKSQYIKMMTSKGRGYTKKQAEALWKKLQAKRRKEKAMVKKGKVTVKKMLKVSKKKSANSWIQFSKDMARENPGLSRSELSELYWLSKDYDKPIKRGKKHKTKSAYENYIKPLDKTIDILSDVKDNQGNTPQKISDTIEIINEVKDKANNEIRDNISHDIENEQEQEQEYKENISFEQWMDLVNKSHDLESAPKSITTKWKRTGRYSHLDIPPGMMKKLLLLEYWKDVKPEEADTLELQIQNILASASGNGNLLHDYY
jgi:hypothetical protein